MTNNLFRAAGVPLVLFFGAHLAAADANYFPLETGNRWVYRASSPVITQTFTVTVGLPVQTDGRIYYSVEGYAEGRVLMRRGDDGNLYLRDQEAGGDVLLTSFDPAAGPYDSPIRESCAHRARAQPRPVPYERYPGADPLPAREIQYQSVCADAGIETELYLGNIGMVRRVESNIGGALFFELIYARVGRVTYEPETAVAFRASVLSSYIRRSNPENRPVIRGSLRVSAYGQPFTLRFPSAQRYDLQLTDSRGNVLQTWSADKLFALVAAEITGPEASFDFEILFTDGSGQPLPDGDYTLTAWLATADDRPLTTRIPLTLVTQR